jgi:hypothetical protein
MFSVLIALALTAAGPATPPADQSSTAAAERSAAEAWIGLIDQQRWDESWTSASAIFHARLPQAGWAEAIKPIRQSLGAVVSRSLVSASRMVTMPGAPDGEYEVVRFVTRFAHKQNAVETVVLAREGGEWKVAGYFVN